RRYFRRSAVIRRMPYGRRPVEWFVSVAAPLCILSAVSCALSGAGRIADGVNKRGFFIKKVEK
ncbi:MAG: hypothetical protein ACYSYT_08870, partial [Planctomycetota bacterium]